MSQISMPVFRRGEPADLPEVAAIQQASPEAAQWNIQDYLRYDFLVAVIDGRICGFLAARAVAESESELLNLAVAPGSRQRGIARSLLRELVALRTGAIFLEVRESNRAARNLYESIGFKEI